MYSSETSSTDGREELTPLFGTVPVEAEAEFAISVLLPSDVVASTHVWGIGADIVN
jgi:hypothetical protein